MAESFDKTEYTIMKFYFYNTVTIKDSAAYIESSVCFFVLSYIIFCFLLAFSVIISTFIFSEYKSILRILIVPLCILYLALYYHGLLKNKGLEIEFYMLIVM